MQRRQLRRRINQAQALRARQGEGVGDAIEIIGHAQARIVDHVIDPVGPPAAQRRDAGGGQVGGVDVVAPGILGGEQGRQSLAQAFERQPVGGVNAGRAQNADAHAAPPAPVGQAPLAQAALGIDAAHGALALRPARARLVDQRPGAIAVNSGRADVDQLPW